MKTSSSIKSGGAWNVNRRINIPVLAHATDGVKIERILNEVPGVREVIVNVEKHLIVVRYDASKSDYQMIVERLENAGFPQSNSWWSRLRGSLYQFTDTNARDNAKAPPPACCNKPPK